MCVCACVCVHAASISTIVCDVPEKVSLVLECMRGREHSVRTIVLMDRLDPELVARGLEADIQILSLADMEVRSWGQGRGQGQGR